MSECSRTSEYVIYSVLGSLILASEALGLTKKIPQNSVVSLVYDALKSLVQKKNISTLPDTRSQQTIIDLDTPVQETNSTPA